MKPDADFTRSDHHYPTPTEGLLAPSSVLLDKVVLSQLANILLGVDQGAPFDPAALVTRAQELVTRVNDLTNDLKDYNKLLVERITAALRDGGVRAVGVVFLENSLIVDLANGQRIQVPLHRYPRLADASNAARANWRLIGGGIGIRWPEIDEDIRVAQLLAVTE